jgi:hypothetical protein
MWKSLPVNIKVDLFAKSNGNRQVIMAKVFEIIIHA